MSAPIRTAVFGFGLAGRVFHCPFVSAVPGLELSAIVQRRGDEAAQAFPSARILRSADEALADPSIQLIVVATPNETHLDLATRALQAGKHVVVDKPITSTAAAARQLIQLATQQGRLLVPFHNRRWDGDFLTLRKLLADGTLGRVVEIVSRFDRFRPLPREGTWKERGTPDTGLLFDLSPHLLDQALTLFGTPDRITANLRHDRDRTDIDDAFDVYLDYDHLSLNSGPARALRYACHGTVLAADPAPRFLVHGTHGSFRKHGVDPQEPVMVATGRRPPSLASSEPWLPEPESDWGTLTLAPVLSQPSQLTQTPIPTIPGDYRHFYANVRDAIRGEAALAVSSEDGYRTLRLIDLARQSHAEHRSLPVTWD
ncbi:MAG TPA: Gfo/Idh/MocA family oxidoreductase [Acidobacteriaceae bacterium]|jgi:predicted dehydrogenase|nr:Gfo/Idh/MocA family oxidoreductase [Acidobacteriaceae bacterium]